MTRAATRDRIIRAREHIRRAEAISDDIASGLGIEADDNFLCDVIWNGEAMAPFLDAHCGGVPPAANAAKKHPATATFNSRRGAGRAPYNGGNMKTADIGTQAAKGVAACNPNAATRNQR